MFNRVICTVAVFAISFLDEYLSMIDVFRFSAFDTRLHVLYLSQFNSSCFIASLRKVLVPRAAYNSLRRRCNFIIVENSNYEVKCICRNLSLIIVPYAR